MATREVRAELGSDMVAELQAAYDVLMVPLLSLQAVMRAPRANQTRHSLMSAACCPASCSSPAWTGCLSATAWSAACSPSSPCGCTLARLPLCLAAPPPCSWMASSGTCPLPCALVPSRRFPLKLLDSLLHASASGPGHVLYLLPPSVP